MEMTFIILAWVIFSVVQILAERQRPPSSKPPPGLTFEIPTLANDPNRGAEVHEVNLAELYRQRKVATIAAPKKIQPPEVQPAEETKDFGIDLTPATAMNAIILGEILNKPKALRRR